MFADIGGRACFQSKKKWIMLFGQIDDQGVGLAGISRKVDVRKVLLVDIGATIPPPQHHHYITWV